MSILKKLFETLSWVRTSLREPYQSEAEAYLSEATDIYDLEHRIRQLDRRGMVC
jgi:Protein of unknown function (DUF3563)